MADRGVLFSATEQRWKSAAGRAKMSADEFVAILNRGDRLCTVCRKIFPRTSEHFRPAKGDVDNLRSRCRNCDAAHDRARYWKNHKENLARQRQYQAKNRDRLYAYNRNWQSQRHRELKHDTIIAYGGRCACCGESEPAFLDIDHINNDGAEHRKEVGNTTRLMLWLKRDGWPKDRVQLLCCNCNQGKARNGGICPHQDKYHGR